MSNNVVNSGSNSDFKTIKPLVSVMIPYYNCKDYIAETIESVEQQDYPNLELIIVNDGSNQEHTEYLLDLLKLKNNHLNNLNIQYIYQENKGLAATRNKAAEYAKGIYFLFLDADDIILPSYISESIDFLEKNPNYKLVYPITELFGAQTGIWNLPPYTGFKSLLLANKMPCIAIHRAEDFKVVNGFDESLKTHEDWDYWIRILANGGEVYQIPKVLFKYRKRENKSSLMDNLLDKQDLLKKDIQYVYIKNSQIFFQYQFSYWDLCQIYWENQELMAHNNEYIKVLGIRDQEIIENTNIIIKQKQTLDAVIDRLNLSIENLNKQIFDIQSEFYQYKRLYIIRFLKPLVQLERGLKSVKQYSKLFLELSKKKGNVNQSFNLCYKVYDQFGLKGLKEFLRQNKK